VHKVSGGSNFNINSTFASLAQSNCTSCQIQADKSAYWTPQLYYKYANGKYEEVPGHGMTVYYLGRGMDPWGNKTAKPFPEGLQMLSGNNSARVKDVNTRTWGKLLWLQFLLIVNNVLGNSTFPSRLVSERVSFACINYSNQTGAETHGIENTYW
jgi:hypothetical protein